MRNQGHLKPVNKLAGRWTKLGRGGQSFIELAILFPLLIMMLSGLVEFGFLLNQYLNLLDGAREAARFASDGDPFTRDANTNCSAALGPITTDFYNQAGCLAVQVIQPPVTLPYVPAMTMDQSTDDVVISAFSIADGSVVDRFPDPSLDPPGGGGTDGEWHLWGYGGSCSGMGEACNPSQLTNADIESRLSGAAPNTGAIAVEVYYDYHQVLGLPWITAFVPNPIHVHVFSIMPLVAAEPID